MHYFINKCLYPNILKLRFNKLIKLLAANSKKHVRFFFFFFSFSVLAEIAEFDTCLVQNCDKSEIQPKIWKLIFCAECQTTLYHNIESYRSEQNKDT